MFNNLRFKSIASLFWSSNLIFYLLLMLLLLIFDFGKIRFYTDNNADKKSSGFFPSSWGMTLITKYKICISKTHFVARKENYLRYFVKNTLSTFWKRQIHAFRLRETRLTHLTFLSAVTLNMAASETRFFLRSAGETPTLGRTWWTRSKDSAKLRIARISRLRQWRATMWCWRDLYAPYAWPISRRPIIWRSISRRFTTTIRRFWDRWKVRVLS